MNCLPESERVSFAEKGGNQRKGLFQRPSPRDEIKELLQGKPASDMFSFKSPSFKALGLNPAGLHDKDLMNLMLSEPRLIRRPVVKIGRHVYFGADIKVLNEIIRQSIENG
jgi:arsenate reductase-like glutaredoxin family protein